MTLTFPEDNKDHLWSERVSRVQRPIRHISLICRFGDESFLANNCIRTQKPRENTHRHKNEPNAMLKTCKQTKINVNQQY